MQINDEHIDEYFARKLRDMEVTPPDGGWLRIENELNHRNRMTRKFWLAAASFALILSVTAAVVYMQTTITQNITPTIAALENISQQPSDEQISSTDQKINTTNHETIRPVVRQDGNEVSKSETTTSVSTSGETVFNGSAAVTDAITDEGIPTISTTTGSTNTTNIQTNPKNNITGLNDVGQYSNIPVYSDSWDEFHQMKPLETNRLNFLSANRNQLRKNIYGKEVPEKVVDTKPIIPIYDDISMVDLANISAPNRPRNRWEVKGQVAPVYSYRTISSVPSGIRRSDFNDAESPLLAYSGGISVAYMLSGRLSIQTGLIYSQMGQSINNVTPVTNMYAAVSSNNSYTKNFVRTSTGSVTVASNMKSEVNTTYASYFNAESQPSVSNSASSPKYRLIERIDYLELPLIVRYKVIDRKLNLYMLSGMSANVLVGNNVFVDNGSELVKSGSTLMARPVNYSGTVGFGLGYHINKNLLFSLEPSFKYFLQSYTTSSQIDSNPYALGLFSGIVYRF